MKKYVFVILGVIFFFVAIFIYDSISLKSNDVSENNLKSNNKLNNISILLETDYNSGVYEASNDSSWPSGNFKFNLKLSRCENGSQLSWDNENKLVLMSSNTSDKCYVYFDKFKVINFYLNDIEYSAESGMTVAEWIDSSYNTDGYYFHKICTEATATEKFSNCKKLFNNEDVIIEESTKYVIYIGQGYGGGLEPVVGTLILNKEQFYLNDSLLSPDSEPINSLEFTALTPNSTQIPNDAFDTMYSFYKGDTDAFAYIGLNEGYKSYIPFVISNSNLAIGTNYNFVTITFDLYNILSENWKNVKILYFSLKSYAWNVITPSVSDYRIKAEFHDDFSIGMPLLIVYKTS